MAENSRNSVDPILIVDDEYMILSAMRTTLRSAGYSSIETVSSGEAALDALRSMRFSLVTLDLYLSDTTGIELLPKIFELQPELSVIVITGADEVELAVQSMQNGAYDFIVKPIDKARLLTSIRNALDSVQLAQENERLRDSILHRQVKNPSAFTLITTEDPTMLSIFHYIEAIADTPLPLLIQGETGTGKELLARAVHSVSGRDGEFIAVNVAGLDDTLFSDTLFGHKKGAYTGASTDRPGMISKASGGTLFLDEIGDLGLESQIKLLRLLQEKEYTPLGSDRAMGTDARLVFAANRPLEELVKAGEFRQDLYYRLRSHSVELPPLRERRNDIPLLTEQFINEASFELDKSVKGIQSEAVRILSGYDFPGNIRELRGLIFDEVLRSAGGSVSADRIRDVVGSSITMEKKQANTSLKQALSKLDNLPSIHETSRVIIDLAMERAGGNITKAAELIGITRSALSKRLTRSNSTD